MWGKFWLAFVVALTVGVTVLTVEVDAQSTANESASCDEAVNLIKQSLKDVRMVREDFQDVKDLLASNEQHNMFCSPSQQQSPSTDSAARKQVFASALEYNCIPMLIQQHINASRTFNRSWAEYKAGFNDMEGNYWLGNDLLSQLTQSGRYKLRFDLQLRNGSWYWAEYTSFVVLNETYNYTLQVSGYSSNADADPFDNHNQMPFSTYDRERKWAITSNCAAVEGGGFWYTHCYSCGVNNSSYRNAFRWYTGSRETLYLQISRMWLTC